MPKTKPEVLLNIINTKVLLEKHFTGGMSDEDFAYDIAKYADIRTTAKKLTEEVINPTPVASLKTERTNMYIDIGMGISAFWDEMRTKTPVEVEEAVKVENIIMNVEAGLDKNLNPDTRKMFLKEVGFTKEQIEEFVPLSDYVEYEYKAKEEIRNTVMEEMGLTPPLNEDDTVLVDSLVEDRLMNEKLIIDDDPARSAPRTYEDMYGLSSENIYNLFTPEDEKVENPNLPDIIPEDAPYISPYVAPTADEILHELLNEDESREQFSTRALDYDIMDSAMNELNALYGSTIEENIAMLQEMEEAAKLADELPILRQEDLEALQADYDRELHDPGVLSDADLEFGKPSDPALE